MTLSPLDTREALPASSAGFPGTTTLRAFVLLVEHGSYTRVAEMMDVTHAAIIQHIKTMERRTGTILFERVNGVLRATTRGTELYLQLRLPVRAIETIFATSVAVTGKQPFTISTVPSIANGWLIPMLPKLQKRFPYLELRIISDLSIIDMKSARVDLSIRGGEGKWHGLVSRKLMSGRAVPIGSTSSPLTQGIKTLKDLATAPLIENPLLPWADWFKVRGFETKDLHFPLVVSDCYSALRAAEHGIGIALGRTGILHAALEARRVRIIELGYSEDSLDWWIVHPTPKARDLLLISICETLLELATAERQPEC